VALAGALLVATAALSLGRSSPPAPVAPPAPPPPATVGADVRSFIGLVYPQTSPGEEYPNGVVHLGEGLVVAEHWRPGQAAPFGWAHVGQGARQMLWMERFLDPPGTTGRRVEVLDAVETGPVEGGYRLQVDGCRRGDPDPDPEITAVVRYVGDEKERPAAADPERTPGEDDAFEFSSDVVAAWRLDRAANRIVPQPPAGLVCQSAGD